MGLDDRAAWKGKKEVTQMKKTFSIGWVVVALLMTSMSVMPLAQLSPAMAATFIVNSTEDAADVNPGDRVCATAGGQCTLRAVIQEVNVLGGKNIVFLRSGTYTLTIAGIDEDEAAKGDLDITRGTLIINGTDASRTIIDGGAMDRVFHILGGASVTMNNITVLNGNNGGSGGGILNEGTLTLNRSVVSGNVVLFYGRGGGIQNAAGTLTLNDTTISGNSAYNGGGIANDQGVATLNRSTISGNSADGNSGGGIINSEGTLTLINSTVSNNSAASPGRVGGGIGNFSEDVMATVALSNCTVASNTAASGGGGAIFNETGGTVTLKNTIVGDSSSGGNCVGLITSNGYNLSSDNTCGLSSPGDLNNTSLVLDPLKDNGGFTFTHALLIGSPAINTGDSSGFLPTDQRGVMRPQGAGPDIGAFESGSSMSNLSEGTVGTEPNIWGSGFGTGKGKVLIGSFSLKILEWTDELIRGQLTKALDPLIYDVTIRPKGTSPIIIQNGFMIKAPEINSVSPTHGLVGEEIIITGSFFGTKKGKVTLGGKSCKVLSWMMEPVTGVSTIRFGVPKRLSPGTYELKVTTTGVGSDVVNFDAD